MYEFILIVPTFFAGVAIGVVIGIYLMSRKDKCT